MNLKYVLEKHHSHQENSLFAEKWGMEYGKGILEQNKFTPKNIFFATL